MMLLQSFSVFQIAPVRVFFLLLVFPLLTPLGSSTIIDRGYESLHSPYGRHSLRSRENRHRQMELGWSKAAESGWLTCQELAA